MNWIFRPKVLVIALLFFSCTNVSAERLSPLQFGLSNARTSVERYEALLRTHQAAVRADCEVSYEGIDHIEIDIPKSATSIPLSYYTDFAGVEIVVRNVQKQIPLFVIKQELHETIVSKGEISRGSFRGNRDLKSDLKLLVIEDERPWVTQRSGYNYGATRKDIVLIKDGIAMNDVISSYSNRSSSPKCLFCAVPNKQIVVKNLVFKRSSDSSQITRLLYVCNQNNVLLQNITVTTPPESELFGDTVIRVENSTNVTMSDIIIDGTYSKPKKFGYGIGLDNIWNSHFVRLKANCSWGVFGNNNINHAILEDCDINRFDIHCYGRDVYCYRTTFREQYNQFSSLFGELVFENCQFINSIPVLFEASYSAYTPFNLIMKDCSIKCAEKYPYLINAGYLNPKENARMELSTISWPNITLKNIAVYLPNGKNTWTLFYVSGRPSVSAEYIDNVSMQAVHIISGTSESPVIRFSNNKMTFRKPLHVAIDDSTIDSLLF